jgi:hypothetical protein
LIASSYINTRPSRLRTAAIATVHWREDSGQQTAPPESEAPVRLDAVRVAAAGDALIAPSNTRRQIAQFARAARPHQRGTPPELAELTAR